MQMARFVKPRREDRHCATVSRLSALRIDLYDRGSTPAVPQLRHWRFEQPEDILRLPRGYPPRNILSATLKRANNSPRSRCVRAKRMGYLEIALNTLGGYRGRRNVKPSV